jgi:hypothetical protein
MAKKTGPRIWWWIVPAVIILAGLGYYLYTRTGPETEKTLTADEQYHDREGGVSGSPREGGGAGPGGKDASMPMPKPPGQAETETSGEEGEVPETFPIEEKKTFESPEVTAQGPMEELFVKAEKAASSPEATPEKDEYCTIIDERISDFFDSVDTAAYLRRFNLEKDAFPYFAQIIKKLEAKPPHPAGEGINPTTLLSNIYFFSRALDRKDLRVIKEVISNESDTMEFNLETFYRWLMLGKACPNPGDVRPPFDITYRYAGFFLNTTGGRAYLFRRPLRLRLLMSYYCVLIVYQADRLGKNSYGLNVFPYIQPLKDELAHHPELEFQNRYINTLNRIENYYLQRR